jgi:hypothetical protein
MGDVSSTGVTAMVPLRSAEAGGSTGNTGEAVQAAKKVALTAKTDNSSFFTSISLILLILKLSSAIDNFNFHVIRCQQNFGRTKAVAPTLNFLQKGTFIGSYPGAIMLLALT